MKLGSRSGIFAATAPLWSHEFSIKAFAQMLPQYKAVVVITLNGGNDGNNLVVPISATYYNQYSALRTNVSLPIASLLPLNGTNHSSIGPVGLHPSMVNVAKRFNQQQAVVVANVGPMIRPLTKTQLKADATLQPEDLLSHPAGKAQWESATTKSLPDTGWGGRVADVIYSQSGRLAPVFTASGSATFTVGHSIQGIAIQAQGGTNAAIPIDLQAAANSLAHVDAQSKNVILSQVAKLRVSSMAEQDLLNQAEASGAILKAPFSSSAFGRNMQTIAKIIQGRSVIGASRQMFYCLQGNYDNHQNLVTSQASSLTELDTNLGAFMDAMDEMGLTDQVLVCTHSDFNRTMQSNASIGTDHAWGNHQIVLGGGINGGRILGTFPDFDLGGNDDYNGQGIWIPSTSVTQMTAGIAAWMGLDNSQIATVFPDLANFTEGPLSFI